MSWGFSSQRRGDAARFQVIDLSRGKTAGGLTSRRRSRRSADLPHPSLPRLRGAVRGNMCCRRLDAFHSSTQLYLPWLDFFRPPTSSPPPPPTGKNASMAGPSGDPAFCKQPYAQTMFDPPDKSCAMRGRVLPASPQSRNTEPEKSIAWPVFIGRPGMTGEFFSTPLGRLAIEI
jgi:hypothetical protein